MATATTLSTSPLVPAAGSRELVIPLGLVAIVLIMVVPLPAVLLDLLLALSISLALTILLVGLYARHPREFSTLPSVLLVATLFRLALNVASTRMILLHGHEGPAAAGYVIQAFGTVVVGGSYAVGLVVFLILVVVNFVVITKGAGRIAEVAARFTLDAMPGKQLAIDAEVNGGLLGERDARARRAAVEAEADFYGAMDGASKFVRGDAIAGLVITAINIVGGFVIGVGQHGVAWATAAETYTVLTIGDGLVSQLPALLVSTAAGIVVTRAASGTDLGSEVTGQLLTNPRVLWTVCGLSGCLALVPGLPFLPFVAIAGAVGALAAAGGVPATDAVVAETGDGAPDLPATAGTPLEPLDPLAVELGPALTPLVDGSAAGGGENDLERRVQALRRALALELGFVAPPIGIRVVGDLPAHAYRVLVRGVEIARDELRPDRLLAIGGPAPATFADGVPAQEPAFGADAVWIAPSDRERAQQRGGTVVDPGTVLVTHLTELVRRHADELLGRQEVKALIDHVATTRPAVVDELVPHLLSVGGVQKVLRNLLRENVPIRDLATILETLADHAGRTRDPDALTAMVRQALARTITQRLVGADGTVALVTLEAPLERALADALEPGDDGTTLPVDPTTARRLVERLGAWMPRFAADGRTPVLLCGTALRPALQRLLVRHLPALVVLAPGEIATSARIRSLGTVTRDDA
jgi:flagellar biosynthesis protein FlhA